MWKKALNIIFGILFLLSLIFNGYSLYQLRHLDAPGAIYLHDTVTITKDCVITKTMWRTNFDTITEIQYKDTVLYDTIYLDIEHKVSEFKIEKDSLKITEKIYHSGFHSTIDSIKLDYNWNYEIPKPKPKKIGLVWNIGPYIGYGINFNKGQYYFSPEVGVGVSIGFGGIIK